MSNEDEISSAVLALLEAALSGGESAQVPSMEMKLSALGLDSLKLIEIVFELETRFKVMVDEEMLARLNTVDDLVIMMTQALGSELA